jgi:uncharacterized membrane protein YkvA (DUF1232 family)
MWQQSKDLARAFKRELAVYRRVLADERTPLSAKIFLGLAVSYLCMPFDLIPDFIPVLGQLDDVVIVPALIYLALRFIPRELLDEHRAQVTHKPAKRSAPDAATRTIKQALQPTAGRPVISLLV